MENTFAVELKGGHCVTLANDQPIPAGEVASFSFHESRNVWRSMVVAPPETPQPEAKYVA